MPHVPAEPVCRSIDEPLGSRMIILGFYDSMPDWAAALICEGKLVAAAEEEAFRRVKHLAGEVKCFNSRQFERQPSACRQSLLHILRSASSRSCASSATR